MFEESEAALEERRKHWNNIEVEAQRLTAAPPGKHVHVQHKIIT